MRADDGWPGGPDEGRMAEAAKPPPSQLSTLTPEGQEDGRGMFRGRSHGIPVRSSGTFAGLRTSATAKAMSACSDICRWDWLLIFLSLRLELVVIGGGPLLFVDQPRRPASFSYGKLASRATRPLIPLNFQCPGNFSFLSARMELVRAPPCKRSPSSNFLRMATPCLSSKSGVGLGVMFGHAALHTTRCDTAYLSMTLKMTFGSSGSLCGALILARSCKNASGHLLKIVLRERFSASIAELGSALRSARSLKA